MYSISTRSFFAMLAAVMLLTGCGTLGSVFTRETEPKNMTVEQLYRRAKEAMNGQNFTEAVKLYETLESRFPYGLQAQQAILDTAYAQYRLGERTLAVAAADRFIKQYPSNDGADYAYYIKGLANFIEDLGLLSFIASQDLSERDQKSARDSYATFKLLTEKFPNSKYAQDAVLRMRYLVNALSRNEMHVARYYFNRGAYQAAINRAQASLTNFPNTPANEEALLIIVQSQRALGNTQVAADTARIFTSTYKKPAETERTAWWKFW
ncbi:MAG: outer membrane protein assembly factor BamD [Betaproteobacteria bacterium]|nr:MAG: outer membrane protein assembly factor BamD [Betaproteobacteria bacterium]